VADDTPRASLPYTGDPATDALLARDPLALIMGFILDQRVTIPKAFSCGRTLRDRMGGVLDAKAVAAVPTADLEVLFRTPPALHRFPNVMARRVQGMCAIVARDFANDASRIWSDGADAATVERRLITLPGIARFKARSIIGILVKRLAVPIPAWEGHIPTEPSMVDVISPETLRAYQLS